MAQSSKDSSDYTFRHWPKDNIIHSGILMLCVPKNFKVTVSTAYMDNQLLKNCKECSETISDTPCLDFVKFCCFSTTLTIPLCCCMIIGAFYFYQAI